MTRKDNHLFGRHFETVILLAFYSLNMVVFWCIVQYPSQNSRRERGFLGGSHGAPRTNGWVINQVLTSDAFSYTFRVMGKRGGGGRSTAFRSHSSGHSKSGHSTASRSHSSGHSRAGHSKVSHAAAARIVKANHKKGRLQIKKKKSYKKKKKKIIKR